MLGSVTPPPANIWRWRMLGGRIPTTLTVRIAGATRAMLMRESERLFGTPILPPSLHGDGNKREAFLPEDRNGDGIIDHVTLVGSDAFCQRSLSLLLSVRLLAVRGFAPLEIESVATPMSDYGPSRIWASTTPFIGPRHAWRTGNRLKAGEKAADQLARMLSSCGLKERPAGVYVHEISGPVDAEEFDLGARGRAAPKNAVSGWFAIEFDTPVSGPIAVGFHSRFGMGQFRPITEEIALATTEI